MAFVKMGIYYKETNKTKSKVPKIFIFNYVLVYNEIKVLTWIRQSQCKTDVESSSERNLSLRF